MKKNKKLVTTILSLALISAIGFGATLAYFTDNATAENTINMGKVDIDLTEPHFDKTDGDEDNTISNVLPGDRITKDPTITLADDSESAYIRATITYMMDGVVMNPLQASQLEGLIELNGTKLVESTQWIKGDSNYYYYQSAVQPGESIVFFDTVVIPGSEWKNEVADSEIQVIVQAEAIQEKNFTPAKNDNQQIVGWNGITAETYQEKVVEAQE